MTVDIKTVDGKYEDAVVIQVFIYIPLIYKIQFKIGHSCECKHYFEARLNLQHALSF